MTPGLIERYRDRLPVGAATPVVTLGEGGTPLLHAPRVSERAGCDVYLKYEGANPTGSFKDRGMTVAVSKALEDGAREAVCASTGNTSAYWKGFGEIGAAPRMLAGQAEGAAPLVHRAPVPNPETVATAIRIGNPARLDQALAAVSESDGGVRALPDGAILAAYRLLA